MSGRIDKSCRPLVKRLKLIDGIELDDKHGNHVKIRYFGRIVGGLPTSASDCKTPLYIRTRLRRNGVPI